MTCAPEEEKESFLIKLPNVGEYDKEQLLSFEKEVLGVYISGHPLEKYEAMWRKNISAVTADFMLDEETGVSRVKDGEKVVVGGMLTAKTIKHTKTGKTMAFVTLEDLVGTVEVVDFSAEIMRNNRNMLEEDSKVFIQGRVSTEDDRPSKLICERVQAFEDVPRELWIQFADLETFQNGEQALHDILTHLRRAGPGDNLPEKAEGGEDVSPETGTFTIDGGSAGKNRNADSV